MPVQAESPASPPHKRAKEMHTPSTASRTPPSRVSDADIDAMTSSLARMDMPTPRGTGKCTYRGIARKKLAFPDEDARSTRNSPTTSRHQSMPQWSDDEVRFLLQYIMLHTDGTSWPTTHDPLFWESAGHVIQIQTRSRYQRSGMYHRRECCVNSEVIL